MVDARRVGFPLRSRVLGSGARIVQARVPLLLQSPSPGFCPVDFIVDPGCGVTSVLRILAEQLGILIPGRDTIRKVEVRSSTGPGVQRVRPGKIGVRVPGLVRRILYGNCHFVEPPHVPYAALLGLADVLDDLRIIFDGTCSIDHPHGQVVFELP